MPKEPRAQAGFTLIELMVSIGIFSLITVLAVFNNAQFNSSVLLTNLAYEVALSVRQAQVYGVTVRRDSSGLFTSAYGVHFSASTPSSYFIFQDTARNRVYDSGSDIILETLNLQKGNTIGRVCADTTCTFGDLDITFERPNPDASFRLNGTGSYQKGEVCIVSPRGTKRRVIVDQTGQISVSVDTTTKCDTSTP
ncbi:MAG TPA: prepilin-type N-terminal cleavage/methylation domain-containing protein [Candidatus Paceibacterota bacterium]